MKKFLVVVGVLGLGLSGLFYYNNYYFNPKSILENSILKEKKFGIEVKEVESSYDNVKAYLMEDDSVPLVAVNFGFKKMGRAYEPKNGVGLLAEGIILDGTGDFDRKELRKFMKEKGIKIALNVGKDDAVFSLSYVKEFERDAWKILKDVMHRQHLNNEDIELLKEQIKVVRNSADENPQNKLKKLILKEFYGEHPYGKDVYPSDEDLKSITDKDIRYYLKKYMAKDVISIGIAGDINSETVKRFMDEVFADLEEKSIAKQLDDFVPIYNKEIKKVDVEFSKQSFVMHISNGIKRLDDDFYPFYVADFVFGGSGLNSRLSKEIREKEGLTYGIYSYLSENDKDHMWNIFYSATPSNMEKIEEILNHEFMLFNEKGISKEELELAKSSLMSSFNLRFASLFNVASQLQLMMAENLGRDFLEKRQDIVKNIKLEDVNRVIRERMSGENRCIFVAKGVN